MMEINERLIKLQALANILQTPNLRNENIEAINHTMNYVINSLHTSVVRLIEDNKE